MVDDLDQALGFQLPQRFPHWHPADAVFIGQRLLAQLLAVGELAGQDATAQGLGDGTGKRLALDRLQGGHGGWLICQSIGYMQMYSIIRSFTVLASGKTEHFCRDFIRMGKGEK